MKNNARFREVVVTKDEKAAQEMAQKITHRGVPLTYIHGKAVIGFGKRKIDNLLALN